MPEKESPAPSGEIIFEVRGQIGLMTLNRPQALNALTLPMVREMDARLRAWADDPAIAAVVVRGEGRAFCAGGDVKAVALATRAAAPVEKNRSRDFFFEEYTLNHRIATFPKPYIALIDGFVMGGGVGISAHGRFRVVGENAVLAMPETAIGFFPDVGGGYFLPRCPGQTGVFLALTGQRIHAMDTVYMGFATHFVPAAVQDRVLAALVEADLRAAADVTQAIEDILSAHAAPAPGESLLASAREEIDDCFGRTRMEDIVDALAGTESDFARKALEALFSVSPTSLKVTLRQMRLGAALPLAEVLTMEYRLSQAFMQSHDFFEGVRAALIDKDRAPRWRPARLADVDDGTVEAYFAARPEDELIL